MSASSLDNEVEILINGNTPPNKQNYVLEQARKGDQVICFLSIKTKLLISWETRKESCVELLNKTIVGNAFKVHDDVNGRLENRLNLEVRRAVSKAKKLNRTGSRQKRENSINSRTHIAILNSDVVTGKHYQTTVWSLETKTETLQHRVLELTHQLEGWREKYEDLEKSKQQLFDNMVKELREKILAQEEAAKQMGANLRRLERLDLQKWPRRCDVGTLSSRQRKRRMDEFSSMAKAALWFSEAFGLRIDAFCATDGQGNKHRVDLNNPQAKPPEHAANENDNPQMSTTKRYDQLPDDQKAKVESLLFLLDKFGVSDSFAHDLTMVFKELPRSYFIKECRRSTNKNCVIQPIPGNFPGAQISFQAKLKEKIKLLVRQSHLKLLAAALIQMFYGGLVIFCH